MNRKPGKIQRLVRLNEFREEQAGLAMQQRLGEAREAERAHAEAKAAAEHVGESKTQAQADGRLDLARYQAALGLEHRALEHAEALRADHAACETRSEIARQDWNAAASATRVSDQRARRERVTYSTFLEKKDFDHLSDLLLTRQERTDD